MNSHGITGGWLTATCLVGAILVGCGASDDTGAERAGEAVDGGAVEGSQPTAPGSGSQSQSSRQSDSGDQSITQSQSSTGATQSSTQSQSGSGGSQSTTQSQSCTGAGDDCSSSSRTSGANSIKTFSGSGSQTISFNVEEPSNLSFTAPAGPHFTVRGDGIAIDESGGEGSVEVEPGDYRDVRVAGERWTIVIRPR